MYVIITQDMTTNQNQMNIGTLVFTRTIQLYGFINVCFFLINFIFFFNWRDFIEASIAYGNSSTIIE